MAAQGLPVNVVPVDDGCTVDPFGVAHLAKQEWIGKDKTDFVIIDSSQGKR